MHKSNKRKIKFQHQTVSFLTMFEYIYYAEMVVNGINPRNRIYRERFQCLLQRIVLEARIGDLYLKFLSMLPF